MKRNFKGETQDQETSATHLEGCECQICLSARKQYEQDRLYEKGVWHDKKIHLINGTTRKNMSCGKTQTDMKKDHEAYSDDINMVNCPECVYCINKIL